VLAVPIKKRPRIEPTHDWQQLYLLVEGPQRCQAQLPQRQSA
jgi:hypothetical protein